MKIGLIARADNSGLGMQTWEFFKHMHPHRTMVVDISRLNGNKQYYERYGENIYSNMFIKGFPTPRDIEYFLQELDVVFIAEAAYNPYLYERARELGVKTANQYNYEFFDWYDAPREKMPDLFIAPSMWHYADVNAFVNNFNVKTGNDIGHVYLHCPVNRELLPFRQNGKARIFLHVAGKSAAHDRNGTMAVIAASRYLKTDAQIIIHFQGEQGLGHQATNTIADYAQYLSTHGDDEKVTIEQIDFKDYQDVYTQGDVLLLPRRYGGNCLPLNEALSVGMPVIMTDISPNNYLLPKNWLIPAHKAAQFTPRDNLTVDIYDVDPIALAAKIDEFYNMEEISFGIENATANRIARTISWEEMKPKYDKVFAELCTRQ